MEFPIDTNISPNNHPCISHLGIYFNIIDTKVIYKKTHKLLFLSSDSF